MNQSAVILLLIFFTVPRVIGQVIEDLPSLEQDSLDRASELDSAYIHKIYLSDLNEKLDLTTFRVPYNFRQYDPARKSDSLYAHGGNPTSAAFGLFKTLEIKNLYEIGLDQYDIVRLDRNYFFEQSVPYTHLFFSPGQTQDHTSLQAKFSRSFQNTSGISFDYRNLGDIGWYKNQAVKYNGLNISTWYIPIDKRMQFHLQYNAQTNVEEHNGGVSDHSLYNISGYELRTLIPIHLEGAITRYHKRSYSLDFFFQLTKVENLSLFNPYVHFESEVENLLYKFFDEDIEDEIGFYGESFGQYSGLRHFIRKRLFKNSVNLHLDYTDRLQLSVGITHHFHSIHQEPIDRTINDLYAIGRLRLNLFKNSILKANAHLGAIDALGEYALSAVFTTDFSFIGRLEATLKSQNKRPALLSNKLYVNQKLLRNNDFALYNETSLSIKYHLQRLGITAVYAQQYIFRAIYFDENNQAQQSNGAYLLTQVQLHENLKIKWFHFDNALFYQVQNNRLYPLPELYTIHSMYIRRNLFKSVMDFKGGFDFRYIFDYKPAAYDPLTATFYLQDDFVAKAYPALDIFIEGKVDNFALFIKGENLLSPVMNDPFFMLKDHPQFDLRLRLGFVWQLWN